MADLVFNKAPLYIGSGVIDLDDNTLMCMLLADTYTPDATDVVKADLVAHELGAGSGYNTGGVALANVTWTESGGITTLDADDPLWTSFSATARYGVVYDDTPTTPVIDPLIVLLDLLANKTGQGGNFYLTLHANGLMRAAV